MLNKSICVYSGKITYKLEWTKIKQDKLSYQFFNQTLFQSVKKWANNKRHQRKRRRGEKKTRWNGKIRRWKDGKIDKR